MSDSSVITNKCPNCGGALIFEPKDQKFHCEYCLSVFTEQEVSEINQKQQDAQVKSPDESQNAEPSTETTDQNENEVGLFICPSCGAEIVTDATTASTFCYYCHNPVVLSSRLSGKFLPEQVLPFQIERQAAEQKFLEWVGKKKFVPKEFFNKKQIQNLSGVYFPYWVVDAELTGNLTAQARNLRVWVQGDTEYTETSEYRINRAGDSQFKNLVKNALQKNLADHLVGAVEPFDMTKAIPFKTQYLSGFTTEKRDIEFSDMKDQVEDEFHQYANALMQNTIVGYDSVMNVQGQQKLDAISQTYALLPIWLVTYQEAGNKKLFYYAMNGQTGKVAGVLPIDKRKLILVSLLIFVIVLAVGITVGYFLS